MNRPIEPRQRGNLLQEGQIPVGRAFRLGIALGQVFVELGLGFFSALTLFMWAFPVRQRAFLTRVSP